MKIGLMDVDSLKHKKEFEGIRKKNDSKQERNKITNIARLKTVYRIITEMQLESSNWSISVLSANKSWHSIMLTKT